MYGVLTAEATTLSVVIRMYGAEHRLNAVMRMNGALRMVDGGSGNAVDGDGGGGEAVSGDEDAQRARRRR